MLCGACNNEVEPVHQYAMGRGLIPKCPTCSAPIQASPHTVETTGKNGSVVTDAAVVVAPADADAPAPSPPRQRAPASAPLDILSVAKARLAFVRERIAELRVLEAEEAMLERMLEAAEPALAPRPNGKAHSRANRLETK